MGGTRSDVPEGATNVVAISAGRFHAFALRSDGSVVGWGDFAYNIPADVTNVVSIAPGYGFSAAVKADGSMVSWGYSGIDGESVIPPSIAFLTNDVETSGTVNSDVLGTYTLTYRAKNSLGIVGSAVRTVVIVDTIPPELTCSSNRIVVATGATGATVTFDVSATDSCSTSVTVRCEPPSGSMFPIGSNTVVSTATDASGNTSQCSFVVTVLGALSTKKGVLA